MENDMRIEVAVASDAGRRRKTNADAYLADQAAGLFAVSDGMGDTPRSALVAKMALEAVQELFLAPWASLPCAEHATHEARERLTLGVMNANARLYAPGRTKDRRVATTFAGVVVCVDGLVVGHVGDSRVYLFRESTGTLARLTDDDTVLGDALRRGVPYDVAIEAPNAHALTRATGARATLELWPTVERWVPGDVALVCTDGLSDLVDADAMAQVLREKSSLDVAARRLVAAANEVRGSDNITVVMVRWLPL